MNTEQIMKSSILRLFLILVIHVFVFSFSCVALAQSEPVTCQELAEEYVPQSTPEATYRLELKLMSQGLYCYDLPIFDPQWRRRGSSVTNSARNKQTARMFDKSFKTYIKGRHAIIYYPEDKKLGPAFLYKDSSGWVLDRTSVIEKIHYGSTWMADEGNYPYLKLLKTVFDFEKGRSNRGVTVYRP